MWIRDILDPGSGIRDGKICIRDPKLTSRIRNTERKKAKRFFA
jgi:hypothetical protein